MWSINVTDGILIKDLNPVLKPDSISLAQLRLNKSIPWGVMSWVQQLITVLCTGPDKLMVLQQAR